MAIKFNKSDSKGEPYGSFNYEVEIGGTKLAGFTQISGIGMQTEVMTYQEGGVHDSTHVFPDTLSPSNVQLHRGVTDSDNFVKWITQAPTVAREKAQKDVVINLNDPNGKTKRGWKLIRSYPVKWTGPEMTASADEFAMEFVELTFDDLQMIK